MLYPDGTTVTAGDFIWWNEGSCLGFVCEVIEISADTDDYIWNEVLEGEPGILIGSGFPFNPGSGYVFYTASMFEDEGIGPLSQEEASEFKRAWSRAEVLSALEFDDHIVEIQPEVENRAFTAWLFSIHESAPDATGRFRMLEEIRIPRTGLA